MSRVHYGRATGFFAERMFLDGPGYLSAAVLYENLVARDLRGFLLSPEASVDEPPAREVTLLLLETWRRVVERQQR